VKLLPSLTLQPEPPNQCEYTDQSIDDFKTDLPF
jgi:hypothetical protein